MASVEVANLSTLAARPTGVRFSWRPLLIINPKPQDRRRRAAGAKPRWPRRPGFRVDGLLLQVDQFGFPILGLGFATQITYSFMACITIRTYFMPNCA